MPSMSPGYFTLIDYNLVTIRNQACAIANPLHAIELKLLIDARLTDLAKLKELTLVEHATEETLREIERLEEVLFQSAARCLLFLESRDLYGKYVVNRKMIRLNESLIERWTRRISRLGYLALAAALGFAAFRALRRIQPHIRNWDL